MKQPGFILLASLIISCSGFQNAQLSDYGKLDAVQNVNIKKDEIYDRIMVYVATKYNSPKKVMEYCDKGQGIITFSGAIEWHQAGNPLYVYYIHYKITINIKDNKYKIAMTPLHWIYSAQGQIGSIFMDQVPTVKNEFNRLNSDIYLFINNKEKDDF